MAQIYAEFLGGPKPSRSVITVRDANDPPREVALKIAEGPPIYTEEGGNQPGVVTEAIYVLERLNTEGTAYYQFSHERDRR